jgi:D-alanyl-D-alanine carboxypeptidase (penicillin-binding protein 5/6)
MKAERRKAEQTFFHLLFSLKFDSSFILHPSSFPLLPRRARPSKSVPVKNRLLAFALIASLLVQFSLVFDLSAAPKKPAAKVRRPAPAAKAKTSRTAVEARPAPVPAVIDPNQPPRVTARSVLVFDQRTNKVLYEKDAEVRRPIASTTKLLTALIIAENGLLSQIVEVEPIDTLCEPTKLYFKPGERYYRRDLLTALLVHSCNDVARALARDNAGGIDEFADKMNARAFALGARDSRFANPNGLPSPGQAQYSTARDLAYIARAAYANATLRSIMSMPRMTWQFNDGRTTSFTNTNKVLLRYPYCNGMKTGYTEAAGHCLVSSATNGDRTVISVCLGDNKSIWNDSQALLQWALIAPQSPLDPEL